MVGNKCDLINERQITIEEGQKLAKSLGDNIKFYETSAKHKINNEVCFYDTVRMIRKHERNKECHGHGNPNSDACKCCLIL